MVYGKMNRKERKNQNANAFRMCVVDDESTLLIALSQMFITSKASSTNDFESLAAQCLHFTDVYNIIFIYIYLLEYIEQSLGAHQNRFWSMRAYTVRFCYFTTVC